MELITTNQVPKAGESNVVKRRKRPSSNKIAIKIKEETRKPSNHDLMIRPSFHKFSQLKFIMLLPKGWAIPKQSERHRKGEKKKIASKSLVKFL